MESDTEMILKSLAEYKNNVYFEEKRKENTDKWLNIIGRNRCFDSCYPQ